MPEGSRQREPTLHGSLASIGTLTGKLSTPKPVNGEEYTGDYQITPSAHEDRTLETKGKYLNRDVTVLKIPTWETSNTSDGYTFYIANE